MRALLDEAEKGANARLTVDLEAQTVTAPDGTAYRFEIDPHHKHCLLEGLDDIGQTLQQASVIDAFEARMRTDTPWL